MQKVVGSSPIIRFNKAPLGGVFCCHHLQRRHGASAICAFVPNRGCVEGVPDRPDAQLPELDVGRVNRLREDAWRRFDELCFRPVDVHTR
jgi:hypothetical protein